MTSLNSFLYPVEVKKVGTKHKVMWQGDLCPLYTWAASQHCTNILTCGTSPIPTLVLILIPIPLHFTVTQSNTSPF